MTDYDKGKDDLFERMRENDAARLEECQHLITRLHETWDKLTNTPADPETTARLTFYLSGLDAAINLIHARMEELGGES